MRSASSAWHSLTPRRFLAMAHRCARDHGADLLLSGPGYPGETRSIVAIAPTRELRITPQTSREEIKNFCFTTEGPALGWLSYELGLRLRGVDTAKPSPLPQGHLKKYAALVEHDAETGACRVLADDTTLEGTLADMLQHASGAAADGNEPGPVIHGQTIHDPAIHDPAMPDLGPARASLSREQYEAAVGRTLEHIRDGQAYQLNLSIRFEQDMAAPDSLRLFMALFRQYPAPFYAWFGSGPFRILSTSPERFLKVEHGRVRSQPIKGTKQVQGDPKAAQRELLASAKERAELSMIVDLMRNDISCHCEYGSVQVAQHCSVFQVDDLLQMHSEVTGQLRKDSDCLDLLLDALPGGSVTGCPKKRAMQLIDSLEPHARGAYCGSFVRIDGERDMDSSILIRTAVHDARTETLTTFAGSGIVVDSRPEREYQETMAKAAKFLRGKAT